MKLSERAVQVVLSLSVWQGKADDKGAASAVETSNSARRGSTVVRKKLLPGCTEHEAVLTMFNSFRTWNYEQTLPWDDNGGRLLCSGNVMDYMQGFRAKQAEIDAALEAFYAVYPTEQAKAALALGALYNPKNYPSIEEVKAKFGVNLNMFPLPDNDDLRNFQGLDPTEVEALINQNEDAMQSRLSAAQDDLMERLRGPVQAMVDRLSIQIGEDGSVFRDSLVENVKDIVALLPKLNLLDNPQLADWGKKAEELIHNPDMLRNSVIVRADTANKARALAAEMGSWYG